MSIFVCIGCSVTVLMDVGVLFVGGGDMSVSQARGFGRGAFVYGSVLSGNCVIVYFIVYCPFGVRSTIFFVSL